MEELGQLTARLRTSVPGPRSRALAERLAHVESRNVTFLSAEGPVFWEEARGANVRDVDGNVYVDLSGAFGVSVAGHTPPPVAEAIEVQARRLVHGMGDVHPPVGKVEFLERLRGFLPWASPRAVLASSGSEAVEIALKTALLATGRPGIVAFEGAYHGLTLGALAATEREDFRGPFRDRLYRGVRFVPFPSGHGKAGVSASAVLERVRWFLREGDGGDEVGAVIVEPIQGRAGVRIPPPGFLEALAGLAREAGALLIFDEIFTGLGRTGRMFAFEHEGVVPDLLCLGKALGGGLPLSACVGPASVMDAWPASRGEALHTSTFLGHPLACASGRALLETLSAWELPDRARKVGDWFLAELRAALAGVAGVSDVRGKGLFIGIEMSSRGRGSPFGGAAARAAAAALREGIISLPAGAWGQVLELSPPLVIGREQLEWAIPRLARAIRWALEAGAETGS